MRHENVHPIFREILNQVSPCPECEMYGVEVHDSKCPLHPDYDPSPYCTVCGDGSGICCTNPQADND